jgi:hypothetical protein
MPMVASLRWCMTKTQANAEVRKKGEVLCTKAKLKFVDAGK